MLAAPDTRLVWYALLTAALAVPLAASAGDEAPFLTRLTVSDNGQEHQLMLTGTAERVFIVFDVYDIAHYVEDTGGRQLLTPTTVVADGRAKAIVIAFARKLGQERIREELDESIRRNAQPGWLAAAQPTIAAFFEAIDRDARSGDQLAFYWFNGGRIHAEFNGERLFSATNTAFAKLIWSIWFGSDAVVDRGQLLARDGRPGES